MPAVVYDALWHIIGFTPGKIKEQRDMKYADDINLIKKIPFQNLQKFLHTDMMNNVVQVYSFEL